jgi:asparagine synthase (glutamine-hydrolysing)
MCGILGSVNFDNTSEYLNLIQHRGPDSSGVKSLTIGDNRVDLLHRRLSIVDLSEAGHQPMTTHDNQGYIVFNGEIYNHLELKKELTHLKFKGHSDTETIVNYFITKSLHDNLSDLNGIFAFAYLDMEKMQISLARDRFGIKPLYYYFDGERMMFSSEIRPLKSCLNPNLDKGMLLNSLKMRYTPSPFSPYEGIKKVEPGQIITFDLQQKPIAITKKYFAKPVTLGSRKGEENKLVQIYGDLFEKAVQRQLMADVDIGVLLSGGIDSSLVAAIATKNLKIKPKAFTIGFDGEHEADEINYAKQTADILGLEHFDKKIGYPDFIGAIEKIIKIVEEPIGTTSIIPMYFLSKLAASQVKVVLSGQGADEPLGGYYKYKALPFLEKARPFSGAASVLKNFSSIYNKNENVRRVLNAMQEPDVISSWMEFNAISSLKEITDILNPRVRKNTLKLLHEKQQILHSIWEKRMPDQDHVKDLFLYFDSRTSLSDDLLMYTDKITMNHGLECRVPILDNDLMEFIESLDSQYKFNAKNGKIIHKEFAKKYLPSSIIERKKLDFKSPTEKWFRDNMNEIENILLGNKFFIDLFNEESVKQLLNVHRKGKNLEKQIFLLLSLNYLLEDRKVATLDEIYFSN